VIDVYFIDVNVADDVIEQLAELLADGERTRANRYRFSDDRRRSIVARAGTRRLAARALGVDPRALVIVEEEHGKPALRHREIEFNASHSGDLVALAFAADTPVGIDVERRRHINDAPALARRFFAAGELKIVANATDADDAFLTIWTAKEAILKASGKGIGAGDLRGFAVPFGNREMRPVIDGWSVAALETPLIGYHAAIAARSGAQRIDARKITAAALI
jgi:4'-phosphopantetheinyl transferase